MYHPSLKYTCTHTYLLTTLRLHDRIPTREVPGGLPVNPCFPIRYVSSVSTHSVQSPWKACMSGGDTLVTVIYRTFVSLDPGISGPNLWMEPRLRQREIPFGKSGRTFGKTIDLCLFLQRPPFMSHTSPGVSRRVPVSSSSTWIGRRSGVKRRDSLFP